MERDEALRQLYRAEAEKKKEQGTVFDKFWFKKHQKKLLWLANSWLGKYIFCFKKMGHYLENKIVKITPFSVGEELSDGQIREHFFGRNEYARKLYWYLLPVWYFMHTWDYFTADHFKLAPKLNFGFSTLTKYPGSIGTDNPVDGVGFLSVGKTTWADFTDAATCDTTSITDTAIDFIWTNYNNGAPVVRGRRGFFCFDTSSIGDTDTISAATFSMAGNGTAESNSDSDVYHLLESGPASTSALATGDWDSFGTTSFGTFSIGSWDETTGTYNALTINASGLAYISKTGITKFGTKAGTDFDKVRPSNAGSNRIYGLMSNNATTKPKLVVTYSVVVAPTVTTQAVDQIAATTATGNGNVTADGGATVTERGTVWGLSANPTTSDTKVTSGSGTGAFTTSLTGLPSGTLIHDRAYAINSSGTSYGSDDSFTTSNAISVSDQLNITESKTITNTTGFANVYDQVNITENRTITNSSLGGINVSDQVNTTENLSDLIPFYFVNVFDQVNTTENITATNSSLGGINISDQLNITENITTTNSSLGGINVSDQVNTTENITSTNSFLGGINVSDQLNITENITITNSSLGNINVSDQINTNENIVITNSSLGGINVSDQVNTTENITITNSSLGNINVSDQINTNEGITGRESVDISVSDQVNTTENINISIDSPRINVFDSINITESTTQVVQSPGLFGINLFDTVSSSEFITTRNLQLGGISVFDLINVLEPSATYDNPNYTYDGTLDYNGHLAISVELNSFVNIYDSLSITENISKIEFSYINVSDQVNTTENIISNTSLSGINVSDQINTTENIAIINSSLGGINVFDQLNIIENITTTNSSLGGINVSDQLNITENLSDYLPIYVLSVVDNIQTIENITRSNPSLGNINIIDNIQITENFVDLIPFYVVITADNIQISEDTSVNSSLGGINVSDRIDINENLSKIEFLYIYSVSDQLTITENIVSQIPFLGNVGVIDNIQITENITPVSPLSDIYILDQLNTTENIISNSLLGDINILENITISDVLVMEGVSMYVLTFDQVIITENFKDLLVLMLTVFDSITVSEKTNIDCQNNISTIEQINISEPAISIESFRFSPSSLRPLGSNEARVSWFMQSIGNGTPSGGIR